MTYIAISIIGILTGAYGVYFGFFITKNHFFNVILPDLADKLAKRGKNDK